jgi:hypothetical protein
MATELIASVISAIFTVFGCCVPVLGTIWRKLQHYWNGTDGTGNSYS